MKAIHLLLLVLIVPLVSFDKLNASLNDAERARAIDYLKSTESGLYAAIKGLSEEQLNFKPDEESWSIAECVEHIAISEQQIFGLVDMSLKTEADPSKRGEVKMTDEQIFGFIVDRSSKVKTRPEFEPDNKYGSHKGALKEYKKLRKEHIDYVKKTNDDLRNHYFEFPFGMTDAYQVIVFMAGHNKRHVLQIEEIKAHADFPK